jgi:hypothetical protein
VRARAIRCACSVSKYPAFRNSRRNPKHASTTGQITIVFPLCRLWGGSPVTEGPHGGHHLGLDQRAAHDAIHGLSLLETQLGEGDPQRPGDRPLRRQDAGKRQLIQGIGIPERQERHFLRELAAERLRGRGSVVRASRGSAKVTARASTRSACRSAVVFSKAR